jgi:hypothetical protein
MTPAAPPLRLGYCTNVHPAETVADLVRALRAYAAPVARRVGLGDVGLRAGRAVVAELLARPESFALLRATLAAHGLAASTWNVFPFGDFHGARVKETVYLPAWDDPRRYAYTLDAARVAAKLAPADDPFVSLSTAPLGYGPTARGDAFLRPLVRLAVALEDLEATTGVRVVVALEPEPSCALETSCDVVRTFARLEVLAHEALGPAGPRRLHARLGVCFDACHHAVLGEDPEQVVADYAAAGVSVYKAQLSNALVAPAGDAAAREALFAADEPRFLHQTTRLRPGAAPLVYPDLDAARAAFAAGEIRNDDELRCHFHVPIYAAAAPPLRTTQADLRRAVAALRRVPELRHFEVETYTFAVLPAALRGLPLLEHLVAESVFARDLLR